MVDFVGRYNLSKDDGKFDDFLKALNVGVVLRKMAVSSKPSLDIYVKADGTVVIKTIMMFRSKCVEFKIGEEFEEKRMDGTTCKTIVKQEGNKLIQIQDCEIPVEVIRELIDDGKILRVTSKCKDVVCVREYTKQS